MRDRDLQNFIAKLRPDEWLALPNGVVVPAAGRATQQVGAPGMAVYVTLEELRGRPATLAEIVTTLGGIGTYEALQALSRIGLLLENHEWSNKDLQHALVRDLLPEDYSSGAAQILSGQPYRFVFFEQQILSAMQLAIRYCPEVGPVPLGANRPLFDELMVKCVLGITDILESTYLSSSKKQCGAGPGQVPEALTSALLRNAFFNYRDQFPNMLARFWDLYLELPRELSGSPNYIDVEAAFAQATGVSLRVYLAVGFAVAGQFMQASGKVGERDLRKFAMDPMAYFSTTTLDHTTIERCVLQLSSDLGSYRRSLLAELARTKEPFFSFVTMRQSPLLRFPNGAYIPLSLRFLQERITVGVYWLIHDHLHGKERTRFQRFFGELFQRYVQDILARAYPTSALLPKRLHFASTYGTRARPKESSDIMLLYGEDVVFIEAIASRLRMEDSGITGDITAFRKDIKDKVVAAARQVDRVVHDFVAGKFALDGFDGRQMRRAHPVVLTFGHIPQSPPTWHEIQRMIDAEGLFKGHLFGPLHLINVEELEILEAYLRSGGSLSLLDILQGRAAHPYYRFLPMKTYMSYEVPPIPGGNQYILERLRDLMRLVIQTLGLQDSKALGHEL